MRQQDIIALFDSLFGNYCLPRQFYVRNDNGIQFVADLVQEYFRSRKVIHEFTKPATPEQDAHIDRAAGAVLSQHYGEGCLSKVRV
jgi:putative transposase